MRILISYNGSDGAMVALHDLRSAGLPDKTEAVVLTTAEANAASIAESGKSTVSRDFPTWTVTAKAASGLPSQAILALAETVKPDLIVIGEPCKDRIDRNKFIGHTPHTVLTETECSIRIARGTKNLGPHLVRIVVGFDGSAGAINAVESIASRQWPDGVEVRLLVVADFSVLTSIGRFTPQMANSSVESKFASQWADSLAAASSANLTKAGIPTSVEVRIGHPVDVIVEEAERWKANVIFVGAHCSANSFEPLLIGSVSAAVAAKANCTVEVVRKPAR